MNAKQVFEIFIEQGIIDQQQADDMLSEVNHSGKTVAQVMVDYAICSEEQFYMMIADALGAEFVNLEGFEPPLDILRKVPAGLAILHKALPIGLEGNTLQIALVDPLNPQTAEELRFALDKDIQVVVSPIWQIEDAYQEVLRHRCFEHG
jgi:type IV pilus assembly protein PilB